MNASLRNVHACLVHENPDCVTDLVRNLRALDPPSEILLYNGGPDPALLRRSFAADGYEPRVHPRPRTASWGRLHMFALDCMRYALDELGADTITFVDSDQLAVRPGYSQRLSAFLDGQPAVGMLGNSPGPQPRTTRIAPAEVAVRELDLWRPFLRRFPDGERQFPHWVFWPSTVVTAPAARALLRTFDEDEQLADVMSRSGIWATEEIILPTLTALLGYEVARSPFSYELVRFRARYTVRALDAGMRKPDVYWAHPVPRRIDDPLRARVRRRFGDYSQANVLATAPAAHPALLVRGPLLARMRSIQGWLEDDEADLVLAAATQALAELPRSCATVELGSYCGRATVPLASVLRALAPGARLVAVDRHDGLVGAADGRLERTGPTLEKLRSNLAAAGLSDQVETVVGDPAAVPWRAPVGFLLVDGLHDYASVAADFGHFEPWLVAGAYVAFHDCASYFPGVQRLVGELLASARYVEVGRARSMVVLKRLSAVAAGQLTLPPESAPVTSTAPPGPAPAPTPRRSRNERPLVSCVMPTAGRPRLAAQAIRYFLRQEIADAELLVVDDGPEAVDAEALADPRVRHIRLDRRLTIGAKRNVGCEHARADLVAHWDDDDWIAPWRLARQLELLATERADVCGLDRLIYFDPRTDRAWRYAWPAGVRPWVSDGTLLYTKEFWRRNPLPNTSQGLDCRFLWNRRPKRVATMPDERFYVATIHTGNTSRKDTTRSLWKETAVAEVHELLGDDLAFYRDAANLGP